MGERRDRRGRLDRDPLPATGPGEDQQRFISRAQIADAVQLLVRVRKLLSVGWQFADLRGLLAAQPVLAVRSAHLRALRRDLEHAPELRPYVRYATDHGLEAVWYSGDCPALGELVIRLRAVAGDEQRLRELVRLAETAGFEFDD